MGWKSQKQNGSQCFPSGAVPIYTESTPWSMAFMGSHAYNHRSELKRLFLWPFPRGRKPEHMDAVDRISRADNGLMRVDLRAQEELGVHSLMHCTFCVMTHKNRLSMCRIDMCFGPMTPNLILRKKGASRRTRAVPNRRIFREEVVGIPCED